MGTRVKSFLGGLVLATAMALLNDAAASPPAMCIVFPNFQFNTADELADDDCSAVCARRVATRNKTPLN